jgi:hypothetical protein
MIGMSWDIMGLKKNITCGLRPEITSMGKTMVCLSPVSWDRPKKGYGEIYPLSSLGSLHF